MRYLCLVYSEDDPEHPLSDEEQLALVDEHIAYDESLKQAGHFLAAAALQPPATAMIVRVRGGRASVSDGPFTETKEQVAGIFLLEARDLNEAVSLATRIPSARYGSVEVRPVWELKTNDHR